MVGADGTESNAVRSVRCIGSNGPQEVQGTKGQAEIFHEACTKMCATIINKKMHQKETESTVPRQVGSPGETACPMLAESHSRVAWLARGKAEHGL